MVNTCGFVEAAKKDSVDTLLAAADLKESGRPGRWSPSAAWPSATARELAEALPEADAVLGFDDYADIADRLQADPGRRAASAPTCRATGAGCCRWLRPPAAAAAGGCRPGHGSRSAGQRPADRACAAG